MTTGKTGTCEHGEFLLREGCPQCIAKNRQGAMPQDDPPEITSTTSRHVDVHAGAAFEDVPDGQVLIQIEPEADDRVKALYAEGVHLLELAEARTITENADLKSATEDLSVIARLKKALTERKDEFVKPVRAFLNGFNDTFKTMLEPIEDADRITRDKMKDFRAEQQRKIAEAQAIEDEKLALAQREAELKGGEITVDLTPVEAPPPPPERVRTDIGMAGTAKVHKWEVTDKAAVPEEYKVVDAGAVGRVVKASKGTIVIPGIRIWDEDTIRVTTR